MFWARCVTNYTVIWCHFQPHHAKLTDISNFERITYCLGTWKNSSVVWLGWSVEKVKCVYEKERLIFSSVVVVAVCRSWQRKWKWPQVSGSLPCCSHINDSSHCVISQPLSIPLSLSHLLSLDSSLLFLAPVSVLFLWKDGAFMGLWIRKFIVFHCVTPPKSHFPLRLVHTWQVIGYISAFNDMRYVLFSCRELDDDIDRIPTYIQKIWRQTN